MRERENEPNISVKNCSDKLTVKLCYNGGANVSVSVSARALQSLETKENRTVRRIN